ncbi:MAG: cohesin domain-containing protein [Dehalococcoidia bacterium]
MVQNCRRVLLSRWLPGPTRPGRLSLRRLYSLFLVLSLLVGFACGHKGPTSTSISTQDLPSQEAGAVATAVAPAGPPASVSIQPATLSVAPNGTASVSLHIQGPPSGVGLWPFDLAYDPAVLQVAECTPAAASICNPSLAPNTLRVVGASVSGLKGDQILATIGFQAVGQAGASSPLRLKVVTLTDPDGTALSPQPANGTITIGSP